MPSGTSVLVPVIFSVHDFFIYSGDGPAPRDARRRGPNCGSGTEFMGTHVPASSHITRGASEILADVDIVTIAESRVGGVRGTAVFCRRCGLKSEVVTSRICKLRINREAVLALAGARLEGANTCVDCASPIKPWRRWENIILDG